MFCTAGGFSAPGNLPMKGSSVGPASQGAGSAKRHSCDSEEIGASGTASPVRQSPRPHRNSHSGTRSTSPSPYQEWTSTTFAAVRAVGSGRRRRRRSQRPHHEHGQRAGNGLAAVVTFVPRPPVPPRLRPIPQHPMSAAVVKLAQAGCPAITWGRK